MDSWIGHHAATPVLKKFFQLTLAFLGCLHLTAGPYALAQMIAWGGMLVSYSQTSTLAQATIDTFSGEKPCEMCERIAEAKRDQGKNDAPGSSEKSPPSRAFHDLFPTDTIGVEPPAATDSVIVAILPPLDAIGLDAEAPLLQPPRLA